VPVGDLTPSEAALYAVVNSQQIADNIAGVATALRHGLTSG
jgi:hypothetical protein